MEIAFVTLGRVRLTADGVEVRIRGRRERAVLACWPPAGRWSRSIA